MNGQTTVETTEHAGLPVPIAALESITRGEVMSQVDIAKRYPRSLAAFRDRSVSMATLTQEIAESCFYKLKRKSSGGDQKLIEGPSVRLAEITAAAYQNIRYGGRVLEIDATHVVAQGFAHDLENNNACTVEVRRRITDKHGRRYSDDMIGVTANAAIAIATRNALFKVVPAALTRPAYDAARRVAVGDVKTLGERRQRMISSFAQIRVTPEMVLAYLERPSIEDISLDDLETLIGVFNAIKDGDTSVDEAFRQERSPIEMPKSNAESKAEAPAHPVTDPPPTDPTGDPSPEEQEAIRAQEQAEAARQPAAPPEPMKSVSPRVDRGMVWNEVMRRAKAEKKTASAVLISLTGVHNMTNLDDCAVLALAKRLQG